MAKLNTHVHVVERDGDGNITQSGTFGPDDKVPDWAVDAITNPDVWADPPSDVQDSASTEAPKDVKEPPRGGPGSSADAWRVFAASQNLAVPDGASARDIQAIWDARN